jgi:hypothetical protein
LPERAQRLLERLTQARLLISRQDGEARMVEVAHEALLRKWPLLRSWLDGAREFLVGKQQLDQDLADWEKAASADKPAALLGGLKLNRARLWLAERPQQMSAAERSFIQTSLVAAEAAEAGRRRLRRNITRGSVAAAVVLAGLALLAASQWRIAEAGREQLVKAANTRARELIGYVWTDLGAKRQAQDRLAGVTAELAKAQARLGQRPADDTGELPEIKQLDGFDCRTGLPDGFRYLYCLVRGVISVPKLEAIAGRSIFLPGGPHGKDLNLTDEMRFGHYDPRFLDWLEPYLIPTEFGDVRSNPITKLVYRSYIGPTARALYRTHDVLFADPARYQAFERDYAALKSRFYQKDGGIGGFEGTPTPFAKVKADYLARLVLPPAQRASDPAERSNGIFFENSFFWLSDYTLKKYHPKVEECCEPWYLASGSAGFWVRRSIDGTEARIFALVKQVLATFEPEVLAGK